MRPVTAARDSLPVSCLWQGVDKIPLTISNAAYAKVQLSPLQDSLSLRLLLPIFAASLIRIMDGIKGRQICYNMGKNRSGTQTIMSNPFT